MALSFQKLFFTIATVFGLFAILIFAEGILIPLGFALLLSFILLPMAQKLESWGVHRMLAAFISILSVLIFLSGGFAFFFAQISSLPSELADFQDKLAQLFADSVLYINRSLGADLDTESLITQAKEWLTNSAFPLAENTVYGSAGFLTSFFAVLIYTFLTLIYRDGLVQAFVMFSPEQERPRVLGMFRSVQKVGQKYLSGMLALILILGCANSLGLWIIGIDSPLLFGFLAAFMSIVPYVGTTLGASIPVLYAFMTHDSLWMPAAVTLLFWSVQLIESNFLSPKVVGSSLQVNALAAIMSLLIGASVWGIAGMILFLPFTAMLKVICNEYEPLKPIALLIDSHIYNEKIETGRPMRRWLEKIERKLYKPKAQDTKAE